MKSIFKPLGEFVRLVDERNSAMITEKVLGINIDKYFMPSVANVIGTDLSNYKLLRKGRFACNPMHVGRDYRLPVSRYTGDEPAIVSPAYFMFEITDEIEIDPEYLMLCFRRPDFDRMCWFRTDASVRGGITWDDICELSIPVPSIVEQRKIVHQYLTITDRINILKKININLDEQLNYIFKSCFGNIVVQKEELPIGWQCAEAQSLFDISIGKTPPRERIDCFTDNSNDIKWISISDMGTNGTYILDTAEKLTSAAVREFNVKLIPANTVIYSFKMTNGRTAITTEECATNEAIAHFRTPDISLSLYSYSYLSAFRFSDLGSTSSITEAVNSKIIKSMPFILPPKELLNDYYSKVAPIFDTIKYNSKELIALKKAASAFLST